MTSGVLRLAPRDPGRRVALLYFLNSLGAVIGVLACVFVVVPLTYWPTAMHIVEVGHDTPESTRALPGFGLATTDQLEPFQRSIKVVTVEPLRASPTAKQLSGLAHETWRRRLEEPPL